MALGLGSRPENSECTFGGLGLWRSDRDFMWMRISLQPPPIWLDVPRTSPRSLRLLSSPMDLVEASSRYMRYRQRQHVCVHAWQPAQALYALDQELRIPTICSSLRGPWEEESCSCLVRQPDSASSTDTVHGSPRSTFYV